MIDDWLAELAAGAAAPPPGPYDPWSEAEREAEHARRSALRRCGQRLVAAGVVLGQPRTILARGVIGRWDVVEHRGRWVPHIDQIRSTPRNHPMLMLARSALRHAWWPFVAPPPRQPWRGAEATEWIADTDAWRTWRTREEARRGADARSHWGVQKGFLLYAERERAVINGIALYSIDGDADAEGQGYIQGATQAEPVLPSAPTFEMPPENRAAGGGPEWADGHFNIVTEHGIRRVRGGVMGVWGIRCESLARQMPDGRPLWGLTHTLTGFRVPVDFTSAGRAKTAAAELETLGDWNDLRSLVPARPWFPAATRLIDALAHRETSRPPRHCVTQSTLPGPAGERTTP